MENEISQKPHKLIFIIITIIVLILTIIGKILSFGWFTIVLIISAIMPLHLVLFTLAGILFSIKTNKTKAMRIIYIFLCITSLLYSYSFIDYGDMNDKYTALMYIFNINIINENILMLLSLISFISNIVLSIITIVLFFKKKTKHEN